MPLHRGFSRPNWCRNEVLPRLVNSTLPIRKFFPHIATSSVVLRCRFRLTRQGTLISQCYRSGDVAEWLRSGLQIRVHRFDSGRRLHRTPLWTLSKSLTSPSPFGIPICHREKLSQIAPCQVRREKIEACLIGEVPEWSNGAVSKTVVPLRAPRVRIPVSPPPSPPVSIPAIGRDPCRGARLSVSPHRKLFAYLTMTGTKALNRSGHGAWIRHATVGLDARLLAQTLTDHAKTLPFRANQHYALELHRVSR